jgi:hypothetical protein
MNAINWLAMQLAWEQRLTELRNQHPTPVIAVAPWAKSAKEQSAKAA